MQIRACTLGAVQAAVFVLLFLGPLSALLADGGDWPQWRGPDRNGVAPAAGNEQLQAALEGPLPAALHQVWKLEVGLGQSAPIIHRGRLYLHARQGEEEVVLALSPDTGEKIWRYAYPVPYNRYTGEEVWRTEEFPPSYASPMAFTIGGVRQIVTLTQNNAIGVRASDGKLLWSKEMRTFMEMNITTPLLYEDQVLIGGYHWGNTLLGVEPGGGSADQPWQVSNVWASKRHELYMDSAVLVDDYAYFRSNKRLGTLVCVEVRTGEQCWQGPPQAARYATFVVMGDRLLVLTDNGDIKVVAADPSEYRELASWEVADTPVFAHLTVAGSRMYVKDEAHLAAFEIAADRITKAPDGPAETAVADAWAPTPEDEAAALEVAAKVLDTQKEATTWKQVEEHLSYWADDFSDYSGQTKADWTEMYRRRFEQIGRIGSPLGADVKSMYVEWAGEVAIVRGIFIDFRPARQAIMERLFYLRKYGDTWKITALDGIPIWERWGSKGEFKATEFSAESPE